MWSRFVMLFSLPLDMQRRRNLSVRRFLVTMLAAGAIPDPHSVSTSSYQGSLLGVLVQCKLYELPPYRWADVELSGGPFGRHRVSGYAWYDADMRVCIDTGLEKTLRRFRVKVLDVNPPAEENCTSMELNIDLPLLGQQRMTLGRVTDAQLALENHRDLLW